MMSRTSLLTFQRNQTRPIYISPMYLFLNIKNSNETIKITQEDRGIPQKDEEISNEKRRVRISCKKDLKNSHFL